MEHLNWLTMAQSGSFWFTLRLIPCFGTTIIRTPR